VSLSTNDAAHSQIDLQAAIGRKQTLEIKESSVSERPLSGADILLLNPKQQLDQQPFGFQNGCFLPGSGY